MRFDGLLIANGARSQLRPKAWVKVDKAYPWGAAWSIVPECQVLDSEILHQFYDRSKIMMGILPTGDSNRTSTAPFKCFLELTYATITKLFAR